MFGCSVTKRVKQVKQPRGGYINPRSMAVTELGEGIQALHLEAPEMAILVGITVDYLSRIMQGTPVADAFKISLLGAKRINEEPTAKRLCREIKGLDKNSIISAVKLSGFDVCYRNGGVGYKPVDNIIPDEGTVDNIITMVKRAQSFFDQYGPKTMDGFTFEGGYTDIVSSGDGDFMTKDTLWDFKVSKSQPTKDHTLQLLMYWRMGLHSIHSEFGQIQYLGIFNPRLNTVYRIAVTKIPNNIIQEVESVVIGY